MPKGACRGSDEVAHACAPPPCRCAGISVSRLYRNWQVFAAEARAAATPMKEMPMPTPRKVAMLAEIKDAMARASVAISADYRGLTVAQLTDLRRALRPANVEVKVVKNTLAALAAKEAGRPEMAELLSGPTAIAIGFGDPVAPVKLLTEHLRAKRMTLEIHGGWLEGKVLSRAEVESLATLPSKEQLIADVVGKLQSPLYNFAGLLQASIRNFAGLIESRATQLEGAA